MVIQSLLVIRSVDETGNHFCPDIPERFKPAKTTSTHVGINTKHEESSHKRIRKTMMIGLSK